MAVKYQCPKCEKRFVDWGAEKVGFKCPQCGETLFQVGKPDGDAPAEKPTLKRKKKEKVAVVKPPREVVEVSTVDDDAEFDVVDVDDEVSEDEDEVAVEAEEAPATVEVVVEDDTDFVDEDTEDDAEEVEDEKE